MVYSIRVHVVEELSPSSIESTTGNVDAQVQRVEYYGVDHRHSDTQDQ